MRVRLGVNIDHIATLRQQRKGLFPSPVDAALAAQKAGCDGIVAHLREDRRHIQELDLWGLKAQLRIPLNMEMSASPEIVKIAARLKPQQATLVPERRQELTTEGGLDLKRNRSRVERAVRALGKAGVRVSLFIDPRPEQVRLAAELAPMVEFHTGRYADAGSPAARRRELEKLRKGAALALDAGLIVAAGHGLNYDNVVPVARISGMEELNIGFSIVARAVEIGFGPAVREMASLVQGRGR